MKFIFRLLCTIGMLIGFAGGALSLESDNAQDSVIAYFDALKNGDVQVVMTMLADPMLASKRLVLEKNTEYPEYLRNFYKNAEIVIRKVDQIDGGMRIVDASIVFAGDANPLNIRFTLKYDERTWKIANETRTPE